jgi:hypothetical protein
MRTLGWLIGLIVGTVTHTYNFDAAKPGTVPSEWTVFADPPGAPAGWEVVRDSTAPSPPNIFAHVARENAGRRRQFAILNKPMVTDGDLSVKMKPVGGKQDRGGGLLWRYRDPQNYYAVEADARDNAIAVWKVEGGKHTALPLLGAPGHGYEMRHPVPVNQWSVLKVQFRGPLFSVYFNHRRLFQARDSTFRQAGQVGLWTKHDSVTYFDDFSVAGK